jgi:glutamine cyclotransferase
MHSGPVKNTLKLIPALCLSLGMLFLISCKDKPVATAIGFKFPEQGQSFGLGDEIKVQLDLPEGTKINSAAYLIDGKPAGNSTDAKPVSLKTSGLAVGYRIISAIVDHDGQKDTATINVVLNSGIKPQEYTYKVIRTFPHDTSAYTEGLAYHDGKLLESTGEEGHSNLRWVELSSGKPLQQVNLDKQYYGEGSALVGDKIIMLTYKTNIGFVYDAKTFKQLGSFPYQTSREGWGLCFDGKNLITSDGSNRLYFMNKDTYKDERVIDVYDNKGAVELVNELEYIDGKLYANLFTKNDVIVIDPNSGIVEKKIDLSGLLPEGYYKDDYSISNYVLNGIAYDKAGKRLFVTGKKWPKLFEIELIPKKN